MSRLQKHQHRGQQQMKKKQNKFSWRSLGENSRQKISGPRLPFSLRRELHLGNRHRALSHEKRFSEEDEEEEEEEAEERSELRTSDIYEYEEDQAPEDSSKNRRFDDVDRFEYELPSDFEDEEIDEEAADGEDLGGHGNEVKQKKSLNSGTNKQTRKLQTSNKRGDNEDITSEIDEDEDDDRDSVVESDGLDTSTWIAKKEIDSDKIYEGSSDDGSEQSQDVDVEKLEDDSDADTKDVEDDDDRHHRMLEAVRTPRKRELRERNAKHIELLSEAYPESEFNINPPAEESSSKHITIEDLMAPLQSTTGFGSLRKRMHQLERKGVAMDAPLPKVLQEKLIRKAGYEKNIEEISKWQDLVKTNREASSVVFTQRPDLTATSTAELVSKFEPSTELEKDIASLLQENGLAEDTSEATTSLGFNKLTIDEVKERQDRLAKMRSVLSHHETKAKRMKKIKSKAYHRLLQKAHKGNVVQGGELDPDSLKEAAMKAEFQRVQERMTLKHKNTSKWAKRIIKRGLKAKEDGSREALAEQLRTHSALTRKIKSINNANSSDDSSDDSNTDSGSIDERSGAFALTKPSKLLAKAKVETLKVLEGDAEADIPKTGLFALPFMARAIEKKRKQAQSEAIAVLEQLEQFEYANNNGIETFGFGLEAETPTNASSGRLAFGDMAKPMSNGKGQEPDMAVEDGSSSDDNDDGKDEVTPAEKTILGRSKGGKTKVVKISDVGNGSGDKTASTTSKKRKTGGSTNFNGFESHAHNLNTTDGAWTDDGIQRATALTVSGHNYHEDVGDLPDVGESRTFNVEIDNPWLYGTLSEKEGMTAKGAGREKHGMEDGDAVPLVASASIEVVRIAGGNQEMNKEIEATSSVMSDPMIAGDALQSRSSSMSDIEETDDDNLKEQGCHFLLENASQAELIQRAFAGDDVEADFEQMKSDAVNEEVPLGEAALSLPGWGQWTDVQKKKGPPLWIVKQQEELKGSREDALNKRKDSKLRHVIISERMDKKAEKFMLPTLPFPFKSKGVFEKSIRMPIGREFNTDQAFRDMIRPAVVKDAGVIIAPIKLKMSDAQNGGPISNSVERRERKSKENHAKEGEKRSKGRVLDHKRTTNNNVNGVKVVGRKK